jgi:type VI secretion system protein ImpE
MDSEALLRQDNLVEALSSLKKEVSAQPSDATLRWFLFQLFCFTGEYERAQNQLNVAAELDKEFQSAALIYSRVMAAELLRSKVAAGEQTPVLLGEPEPWLAKLFEANRILGQGQLEAATALRMEAFDAQPAISGKCNETDFEWICDQDSRFAGNLECFLNGKYYWIPLSQVKTLMLSTESKSYTDLLYPRAELVLRTEAELDVMLFARYPGEYSPDARDLAMNRLTEWKDINDYTALGRGQRMFCADSGEFPLLEWQVLSFD